MSITVLKADGTSEYFKAEKLRRSLRRSGASPDEVNRILQSVAERLYDGIRTQQIYRYAFELLRSSESTAATRYSMRRALFGLGPTGFPFERFMARLYTTEGFTAKTNLTLEGKCATHEIDVAVYNETSSFVTEVKFHARPGMKTDLQVAMYSYARLLDLKDIKVCQDDVCGIKNFHLVTNTKFTSAAERYASCTGIELLSWDFPKKNNLHDRIQRAKIYPITVLSSLNPHQTTALFSHDIIICRDLLESPHVLNQLHLPKSKEYQVLEEAKRIVNS